MTEITPITDEEFLKKYRLKLGDHVYVPLPKDSYKIERTRKLPAIYRMLGRVVGVERYEKYKKPMEFKVIVEWDGLIRMAVEPNILKIGLNDGYKHHYTYVKRNPIK